MAKKGSFTQRREVAHNSGKGGGHSDRTRRRMTERPHLVAASKEDV